MIILKKTFKIYILFFCIFWTPKLANTQPEAINKKALYDLVDKVNRSLEKKDYKILGEFLPPRFITIIAQMTHIKAENLRAELIASLEKRKSLNKSVYFSKNDIKFSEISGIPYAFIPLIRKDEKGTLRSITLAIVEKNQWYFLYGVSDMAESPIFIKIYPFLKDLKIEETKWLEENKNK